MNKMYILGMVIMMLSYGLGILTPYLRKKVKSTETKIDDIALEIALNVVSFIDKTLNGKSGESKKQRAMDLITIQASKLGLNLPKEMLGELVEKAVTINTVEKINGETENLVPIGDDMGK